MPSHLQEHIDAAIAYIRRADHLTGASRAQNAAVHLRSASALVVSTAAIEEALRHAEVLIVQFRGELEAVRFGIPGTAVADARDRALRAIVDLGKSIEGASPSETAKALGLGSPF